MFLSEKKLCYSSRRNPKNHEGGNALFIVLIAIVLFGLLVQMVTNSSRQQTGIVENQTADNEISQMFSQSAALENAINQMVVSGENPSDVHADLSILRLGDVGFDDPPHNLKIYHPMGGGVVYMAASSNSAAAIATNFNINRWSSIAGVGKTDAGGDILFIANISSAATCGRINKLLLGSATVPTMTTVDFNSLFGGAIWLIDSGMCPGCVGQPRLCVSNTNGTAWGYYAALLPG